MGGFSLQLDLSQLDKDISQLERSLEAIGKTLAVHGRGEVIAGRRRKMAHERRNVRLGREGVRTLGGAHIANFLRAKGHDPFKYPTADWMAVQQGIDSEVAGAIAIAYHTKRPQTDRVRRAIIGAAMDLAELARDRITSGQLGENTKKSARRKAILANMGIATRRYGSPPPYGVLTGRFVESIRWRWRRGYRPGGIVARGDVQSSMIRWTFAESEYFERWY